MNVIEQMPRLESVLLSTAELSRSGLSPRGIAAGVREGALVSLRRGWYATHDDFAPLKPEQQHLLRVLAADREAATQPVFSYESAAVLLGLPLSGEAPGQSDRVHITTRDDGRGGTEAHVVRHRSKLREDEIIEVGPLRCTSSTRTLLDIARFRPGAYALGCADAWLRSEYRIRRAVDHERVREWRGGMADALNALPRCPGSRRARRVLALADPVKDSPLESRSHFFIDELGLEVRLQVRVPGRQGYPYFLDFEFVGLDLFGEADGKQKYTDPEMRQGRSADEVVYAEKRRDNWISATQSKEIIHWGYPETGSLRIFAEYLRSCALPIDVPRVPESHRNRQTGLRT